MSIVCLVHNTMGETVNNNADRRPKQWDDPWYTTTYLLSDCALCPNYTTRGSLDNLIVLIKASIVDSYYTRLHICKNDSYRKQ